ncbi:MAG: kinase [Desulfurococcaceae archaeon]
MKIIVPLHVSGVWIAKYSDDPLETGSLGAGLNLAVYAVGRELAGSCRLLVNRFEVFREQALEVCNHAGTSTGVEVELPVELGKGFGASAALLIAHSLVSHALAGKPSLRALQVAHIVEVKYRTGLGDVIAEYTGGLAIRVKPGAPGVGLAYRVIPRQRVDLVVAELNGVEDTSRMLSRITSEVYRVGENLLNRVVETEDVHVFFESARKFTSMLFDYTPAKSLLSGLKGVIDYYMKKSALVVWVEREYADDVLSSIRSKGIRAFKTTISPIGVNLVHTN